MEDAEFVALVAGDVLGVDDMLIDALEVGDVVKLRVCVVDADDVKDEDGVVVPELLADVVAVDVKDEEPLALIEDVWVEVIVVVCVVSGVVTWQPTRDPATYWSKPKLRVDAVSSHVV